MGGGGEKATAKNNIELTMKQVFENHQDSVWSIPFKCVCVYDILLVAVHSAMVSYTSCPPHLFVNVVVVIVLFTNLPFPSDSTLHFVQFACAIKTGPAQTSTSNKAIIFLSLSLLGPLC